MPRASVARSDIGAERLLAARGGLESLAGRHELAGVKRGHRASERLPGQGVDGVEVDDTVGGNALPCNSVGRSGGHSMEERAAEILRQASRAAASGGPDTKH